MNVKSLVERKYQKSERSRERGIVLETVFTKDELLRVIINWLYLEKPKQSEIRFVDVNGIEINGIEKVIIRTEK